MGVHIEVSYDGQLQCNAVHGPSGDRITTDAPVDNHGRGLHFSPTDLIAAGLGACVLTTMGIAARAHGIELAGSRVQVDKHMAADPVRRIAQLEVRLFLPARLSEKQRGLMEAAARTCPVAASLSPETRVTIDIRYV
jgi:putative redox protein